MAFHAKLAADHIDGYPLVKQPGSDGFSLLSTPLFQVSFKSSDVPELAGLQTFLQDSKVSNFWKLSFYRHSTCQTLTRKN